jgi:raffinose/stachyose/melibiose transport system substrate-binding protein
METMLFSLQGRKTRILALAATAALAVTVFSGCSGSSSGGSAGSKTSGTVQWWGWTPDDSEAQQIIASFNQQYPDITVQFKKIQDANYNAALRPALASNSGPDVFDVAAGGATGDVSTFGVDAIDLTPAMVELRGDEWTKDLYPAGISAFTDQNGKLKAAQVGRIASGFLWINQGLFDTYNLTPPTNLEEWNQVCSVFRANGLGCLKEGIGQPGFDIDTLHSLSDSIEPGVFSKATIGEAAWTDPTIVQAFALFKKLSDDGILDTGAVGIQQYPDANNAFLSGQAPMVQMGSWYQQYATKPALQAAVSAAGVAADAPLITMVPVPFPDVAGKGNTPQLFGDPDYALAVNSRSKVQGAATTFALWLSSTTEGQQLIADRLTDYPALETVSTDWSKDSLIDPAVQEPALKALGERVNSVDQARQANLSAAMIQALVTADQAVIGGQSSPEQAAATVQSAFESAK